jgi:hypothetical protein
MRAHKSAEIHQTLIENSPFMNPMRVHADYGLGVASCSDLP